LGLKSKAVLSTGAVKWRLVNRGGSASSVTAGNVVEQDREGAGASVAVPFGGEEATYPVGGLRRWLDGAAVSEGRVFRRIDRHGNPGPALSDRALADIVTARAAAAGLEGDFAGHSLRAGFATAAARAGRSEAAIMRHGRWKSVQIARRYIRQGARWDDNPAADLGL
jgi:hypothetical protein